MTPRTALQPRTALLFLLLVPAAAAAAREAVAAQGPWPPAPSLVRHPEEIDVPSDPATQATLRVSHSGLDVFLRGHRSWRATIDPHSGSVDRAFGDGLELDPGGAPAERVLRFLERHRGLFASGVDAGPMRLIFDEASRTPLAGTDARLLHMRLQKDSLDVLGAGVSLGTRGDRVVLISTRGLAPVATSSNPKLDADQALRAASEYAGHPEGLESRREATLAFYPRLEPRGAARALAHHLVWIVQVKPADAPFWDWHVAWVDAHDGEVLAFFPEAQTAGSCMAEPASSRSSVLGGVRPNRADDAEQVRHFPFARVSVDGTLVTADRNGRFPFSGGAAVSTLDGEFFRLHCDNCVQPAEPLAPRNGSGDVDFGTGGASGSIPIFGNQLSTPADRTAYYQVSQARFLLEKWDSAPFPAIDVFANIADTCNAFSLSYMLGFFVAGDGCRNTAEIRDVVAHELGHTWDRFDGNGITSGATSEWKGDMLALLLGGDSCVGESFFVSGGPSTACSGVRDLDEKAPGRADLPLTPLVCPTCATLTRSSSPCGSSVHCNGQIPGQAVWHMLRSMRSGEDYITGLGLPAGNPQLPDDLIRWLAERWLIGAGPAMQTFNPAAAGVSIYDAIMLIDDDDANLANGTPHAGYINGPFAHHEVAESPEIPDSANCAPLDDPAATATVDRDPASGLALVRLDWAGVPGASYYDVYRNERVGDAFLPVALGVAAGPVEDVGLQVGVTYRYFVAAVRDTGCATISPGGSLLTVPVAPAELRVASHVLTEAPGGADMDGLIEPGERIAVDLTLRETGGAAAATGVTASISGTLPSSPVGTPGPVGFGTVAAAGTAAGASAFEVFIGPGEPCGAAIHFRVSATGNEGCWQDGFDVPIAQSGLGCAVTSSSFVQVVPGSVQTIATTGDADAVADNCEAATVAYEIRNYGTAASGPAGATVTTPHAGVTFSPAPPDCVSAGLDGGEIAPCQFTFSLSGAAPAGVPFTLTADSAGNPAPSVFPIVVGAESDPPAYGVVSYGFEGTLEGWTAEQFALSGDRAFAGSQSVHAGSLSQNNLCGRLTSPPLLLDPAGGSILSFRLYSDIEPFTDFWYDRANVHIIDAGTGQHALEAPDAGLAYNASGNEQGGLCHISGQNGWGGLLGGFSLVSIDLSAYAGRTIRIEFNYATDEGDNREGIYIDALSVSAAAPGTPADMQPDACSVPEVSPMGAATALTVQALPPDDFRFSWEDLGPGFQYNLYAGSLGVYYNHGAAPLSCAQVGSGVSCNGTSCTLDEPAAGMPGGDLYFLVTGAGFGEEGTAGFNSAGAERNPAQSSCAP